MDALSLLRRDHRELKKVLAELEPTTDRAVRTRTRLFAQLERELIAHETIEEELFYPALRARPSAAEMARTHERHRVVDDLVEPVRRVPVSDPTWLAHTRRLKDGLESHFLEEESELFELARRTFSSAELQELGLRMADRRAAVVRELSNGRTPPNP
jgi:hemerythrin-like domain-containing protein